MKTDENLMIAEQKCLVFATSFCLNQPQSIYKVKVTCLLSYFDFCPSVPLVRFRHPITLLRYAGKRIKVCIERNNMQLDVI